MSAKALIGQIQVQNPCAAAWDSMVGNDQIRFCAHCNLSVHNLTEMTRNQVMRLIARSEGRLCVRYQRRPDGSPVTASPGRLHRIGGRISRVAAGAFTATLSVTGAAAQVSQSASDSAGNAPALAQPNDRWSPGGSIMGRVIDVNDARIPSASISLSSEQLNLALYTSSDYAGEYIFEGLKAGIYDLRIEAPGFAPSEVKGVYLSQNRQIRTDQTLQVAGIEAEVEVVSGEERSVSWVGGAVAIAAPADPLIRAAQQDELESVAELLAGRNVNLRDKSSGTTALEHAVRNANREMVRLLISAGAEVNAQNNAGETVLMMLDGDATSDLVWDLLNSGAKVNAKDKLDNTPLIEAASCNNLELLKTLLEAGAEVNAKTKGGQTALMMAASNGLVNNLRTLILAGAEVTALDSEGKNALFYASDNNHSAVVRLLQSQGAQQVAVKTEKD